MKIRIIASVFLFIVAIIFGVRVYFVNSNDYFPKVVEYNMLDEIELENDFFISSSENMNGYSITIIDTEITSVEKFQKQYSEYQNNMKAEFIFLVKVRFANKSNLFDEKSGVNLGQYILQEKDYINFMDREAYTLINGFDTIRFSLKPNTTYEITIPFYIDTQYINVKNIIKGQSTLVVSLYPNKKVIKLKNVKETLN